MKPEIYRELTILRPYNLAEAIGLAKLVESKIVDSRSTQMRFSRPTIIPSPASQPQNKPSILGLGPSVPPASSTLPVQNFSQSNLQERRAKGLCFFCDDKFTHGHRCRNKQFMILITEDEEPPPPEDLVSITSETVEETVQSSDVSLDSMHFYLSHAALGNLLSPRILRIHDLINGLQVTILIDSGSSQNIV